MRLVTMLLSLFNFGIILKFTSALSTPNVQDLLQFEPDATREVRSALTLSLCQFLEYFFIAFALYFKFASILLGQGDIILEM